MRLSWKIGSLFKIPVRLHYSMVIIPVIAFQMVPGSGPLTMIVGLSLALLLFGSVLAHELGHALTGRKFGVETIDIILTPIGGMARIANIPTKPSQEIAISIAGPIVSMSIAVATHITVLVLGSLFPVPTLLLLGLEILYDLNLMLSLFNLIPALPMDGGRVLRGLLSLKFKDHLKATQIASKIGRALAITGGLVGIVVYQNWSLVFISIFIFISAGTELRMAQMREARRRSPNPFNEGPFQGSRQVWTWSSDGNNQSTQSTKVSSTSDKPIIIEGGKVKIISRHNPKK